LARDVDLIRIVRHPGSSPFEIKTCPNGTPGLVYQRGVPELPIRSIVTRSRRSVTVPGLFLHGLGPEPSVMAFSGSPSLVVQVVLRPFGLASVFGIPGQRVGLGSLAAAEFGASALLETLGALETDTEIVGCLWDFLETSRSHRGHRDLAVEAVVAQVFDDPGTHSTESLAPRVALSSRQLQRRFRTTVGCSLKTFLRIRRANLALAHLQRKDAPSLSALAYELGYSDQSHFIRDLKEFTWLVPSRLGAAFETPGGPAGFSFSGD
jgi:AraC-like DNA-binding protein